MKRLGKGDCKGENLKKTSKNNTIKKSEMDLQKNQKRTAENEKGGIL